MRGFLTLQEVSLLNGLDMMTGNENIYIGFNLADKGFVLLQGSD